MIPYCMIQLSLLPMGTKAPDETGLHCYSLCSLLQRASVLSQRFLISLPSVSNSTPYAWFTDTSSSIYKSFIPGKGQTPLALLQINNQGMQTPMLLFIKPVCWGGIPSLERIKTERSELKRSGISKYI